LTKFGEFLVPERGRKVILIELGNVKRGYFGAKDHRAEDLKEERPESHIC